MTDPNGRVTVEPMFYVRLLKDGLYEGPIHRSKYEQEYKGDPGWTPLLASKERNTLDLTEAEIDQIVKWPRQNADTFDELARLVAKATAAAISAKVDLAASLPSSLTAEQAEILRLHRLLAEARLDADRGWSRYAMANRMCVSYQDERAAALGLPKMDVQAFFAEAAKTDLSAKDLAEGVAARTVPGHGQEAAGLDADNYRWLFNGRTQEECSDPEVGSKPPTAQDVVISELAGFYFSKSDVDRLIAKARCLQETEGTSHE